MIRDRPPKAEEKEWNGENHEAVADTVEHRLPRVFVLVFRTEEGRRPISQSPSSSSADSPGVAT